MQPGDSAATTAVPSVVDPQRGQYANAAEGKKSGGAGGVLFFLGLAVGVYAFSPGARYFYKHGYLPPARR